LAQESRRANHLVREKSPYLQQHAYNPVDWYPWGEEAFAKARQEDKPIFLSIGYSTCHWCHVMERESFESPEVAELLNQSFISIKVDREERPDVDRVYMTFVQASTGSGGWPLSVFLTPDLKPFFGGTYFPPEDTQGRAGFPGLLQRIAEVWHTQRQEIRQSGEDITAQLRRAAAPGARQLLDSSVPYRLFKELQASFDARNGGFNGAPKFPRAANFNFLLRYFAQTGDQEAARLVLLTLFAMAYGGLYDHLGGGFHRYSVDEHWHVPHFEKMLYDQAQLAITYLEAFQVTHNAFFAAIARETLDYVLRDLTDPQAGAFYSAEDADSPVASGSEEKVEGAFYVWTHSEIDEALGGMRIPTVPGQVADGGLREEAGPQPAIPNPQSTPAEVFKYHYAILPDGNAGEHGELAGKNVLHVVRTPEQTAEKFGGTPEEVERALETARARLRAVRVARPRPHRDEKIICAWNGLMISALARAAQVLGERRYEEAARRAARFVKDTLWNDNDQLLSRRYRAGEVAFEAGAEDYALLAQGVLDLYEASFDLEWLVFAERLTGRMAELFWDGEAGGFFSTSGRDPSILLRMKEDYDGAEPSPNSVAALSLVRLAEMLNRDDWREMAGKTVQAFAERLNQAPQALPQMAAAMMSLDQAPMQVVIAGEAGRPDTEALLRALHQRFLPNKVVMLAGRATHQELDGRLPYLNDMQPREGHATAYVCHHYACQRPVSDPEALREVLGRAASLPAS